MPKPAPAKIPPVVWLIGIGGLFGYHFFYFTALRNAPAVEASLIAYLWPLLIVVGSALMPGERLRWNHVAGAVLGLAGTVLIVTKGGGLSFESRYAFGYAMAGVCALLWSSYSLLSRRFAAVPTSIVTWFCAATSALSLICHLALEQTVLPVRHGAMAGRAGAWADAGRGRLLRLGLRGKARQHPGAGGGKLRRAAFVDAGADCHRICRTDLERHCRLPADHPRCRARGATQGCSSAARSAARRADA